MASIPSASPARLASPARRTSPARCARSAVRSALRVGVTRGLPLLLTGFVACTGLTLGDNSAGQDTYLELGAIAVDDRTDISFVLRKRNAQDGKSAIKTLWAIPRTGSPKAVATLDGQGDVRVLFPTGGVLLMAEEGGKEFLTLLDATTFEVKQKAVHDARYQGTRMSPSRRWVAVANNKKASKDGKVPVVLIDTTDLSARELPAKADWLEAMWARGSDTLIVMAAWHDADAKNGDWLISWDRTRLLSWKMTSLVQSSFQAGADGFWANKHMDVSLPGYGPDFFFSFSWVGISPDDAYAVFPMLKMPKKSASTSPEGSAETGAGSQAKEPATKSKPTYQLAVVPLNAPAGAQPLVRFVDNAKGPVGFTADGGSIVSYRDVDRDNDGNTDGQDLLAIDINKLTVEQLTVPFSGLINFFITGNGHFVVVAGWNGNAKLALFDLDSDKGTSIAGPKLDLHEVVPRPKAQELWVVDDGLFRLDVKVGELESIQLPFVPAHANLLPKADVLVAGDRVGEVLAFISPTTGKVLRNVSLPQPE